MTSSSVVINPAFHRYPAEAAVVGRLLAAFGELEFLVLAYARRASKNSEIPFLRAMYRLRATSARLQAADAFLKPICEHFSITEDYERAINATKYCLKIRNQFSHCNWGDDASRPGSGIFFIDLEDAFEDEVDFQLHYKPINLELLTSQEAYFVYAVEYLRWINEELGFKRGILSSNVWPKPLILEPPPLHTPLAQCVPPWLSEGQKTLYLARATAAKSGVPTPTPKQQALDKAREAKKARKQADRDATSKRSHSGPK